MKDVFTILSSLEKDENIHLGRLLLLLHIFNGENRAGEIEGLTKLAKLDFFLRYPVYLQRAMQISGKELKRGVPQEYERMSVEAKMVRFRYGPWDFRYRRFLNTLIGKRFAYIRQEGRSYYLGITDEGVQAALKLELNPAFADLIDRAKTIKSNFNFSGTWLMRFIYKNFPEIGSLQYGHEIL
jgi:hypothetical protein